jgi:integrase
MATSTLPSTLDPASTALVAKFDALSGDQRTAVRVHLSHDQSVLALLREFDILPDEQRAAIRPYFTRQSLRRRGGQHGRGVKHKLTNRFVKTAPLGFWSDGANLYLRVRPGSKSWVRRKKIAGRRLPQDYGLGSAHEVSLAEARRMNEEIATKERVGIDIRVEKCEAGLAAELQRKKAMTFRQCDDAYVASRGKGWGSTKHGRQWVQSIKDFALPIFGDLPVEKIDTALVMKAVEPIWHTKTETGSRLRSRIEKELDWAATAGFRPADVPNPARWRGHLENLLPSKRQITRIRHFAALPYADLQGFWIELSTQTGVGAEALMWTILTASRTGDTLGLKWSEIDPGQKLVTIPADRMKAGKEHRIPLSEPALEILARMRRLPPSEFVFPGKGGRRQSHGSTIMLNVLKRMSRSELTVHGFRSTFSDWCNERTNFPSEARELALAHTIGNRVEAAYRRGDMFAIRRRLMDEWARFVTTPPSIGSGEVVPLNAARSSA